ncbi:glutamate-cysteine ligase family protein [Kitasatospora cineracea]|uniref:glutamate-cysteine ligase family protein n=1 Tax=Kitasatospora cineracea TaxID=88074 RepID=UPI00369E68FD
MSRPQPLGRADLLAPLTPAPDASERVGVEVECALLDPVTGIGARYSGPRGVRAVRAAVLERWGGEPEYDTRQLTGVRLPGGGSVTLEHGGRIEYSSMPAPGVGGAVDEVRAALERLADLAAGFGPALVPGGNLPFGRLADVERVPMTRGAAMRRYFAGLGPAGERAPQMMALSLSTRATLDFLGPEDLTRKLRMQTAVAPRSPRCSSTPRCWKAVRAACCPTAAGPGCGRTRSAPACCRPPCAPT